MCVCVRSVCSSDEARRTFFQQTENKFKQSVSQTYCQLNNGTIYKYIQHRLYLIVKKSSFILKYEIVLHQNYLLFDFDSSSSSLLHSTTCMSVYFTVSFEC